MFACSGTTFSAIEQYSPSEHVLDESREIAFDLRLSRGHVVEDATRLVVAMFLDQRVDQGGGGIEVMKPTFAGIEHHSFVVHPFNVVVGCNPHD